MAWQLLPTDYTDAVWSGLKRYSMVNNEDGTVSFQDVTVYSHKENSFFGAKDANRMNEALNTIMSMLENGTDLYSAFQDYFATQKTLFEDTATATQNGFDEYVADLKTEGDEFIETIKTDYHDEIMEFEATQEQVFNTWFELIKGQLSTDVAGNLQNQITELNEDLSNISSTSQSHTIQRVTGSDGIHGMRSKQGTLQYETDSGWNRAKADTCYWAATISPADWQQGDVNVTDLTYWWEATIENASISDDDVVIVMPADSVSANAFASILSLPETYDGGFKLYAAKASATPVNICYVIAHKEVQ